MANFVFCPVKYSIQNSYEIPTTLREDEGTENHEKGLLLRFVDTFRDVYVSEGTSASNELFGYGEYKDLITNLKDAEMIYGDHVKNEKHEHVDFSDGFIGVPDYVFKNINGVNFIVEEKFKSIKRLNVDGNEEYKRPVYNGYFYDNHKVQLASYLYYLKEFDAQFGYLVYWLPVKVISYDGIGGYRHDFYIECHVYKISKNADVFNYLKLTFHKVKNFRQIGTVNFDINKLNLNKCRRCSCNMYCGHKSKKFDKLSFPYEDSYNKLHFVKFPDELKKNY